MRFQEARKAILFAVVTGMAVMPVQQTAALQPYRPESSPRLPVNKVPAQLTAAVARAFQIDEASTRDAAFVRSPGPEIDGLLHWRQSQLLQS